jgi:hypothetical protein
VINLNFKPILKFCTIKYLFFLQFIQFRTYGLRSHMDANLFIDPSHKNYDKIHSFISVPYVEKYNLFLALLKCQMIVSSLGGDMPAR